MQRVGINFGCSVVLSNFFLSNRLINEELRRKIFPGALETLNTVHLDFLGQLEPRVAAWNEESCLGKCSSKCFGSPRLDFCMLVRSGSCFLAGEYSKLYATLPCLMCRSASCF